MKWIRKDLEQYIQAKEYIDTLIIPLVPFHLSDDNEVTKHAFQTEVLTSFSIELEKELSGRVMLTPNYYYLKSVKKEDEIVRINSWVEDTKKQPFKYVFFVSFDSTWKKHEPSLEGTLLWLPSMLTGDIHSEEISHIIRDQVKQVSELIRSYW